MPATWLREGRTAAAGATHWLPRRLRIRLGGLIDRLRGQNAFIERDYSAWIARYQQMDAAAETAMKAAIANFVDPPLISVVMPVYNPAPDHLRAAIRSVQAQIYDRWELCIADDASPDGAIAPLLQQMQAEDPRIKVVSRERNGHISAASNSALQLATGSFVALLDHDDLLSPRAFYEVAARIVERPEIDIIYSDEDHIDDAGRQSHPYFKPGWNPELMLGQNLISHLGVFRRALIERIGGFRLGFEGSQDYDLALRVLAETTADRVVHIPMVLYHWRQGTGKSTFSEASHNRCVMNGRRAVYEFATRVDTRAQVVPAPSISTWSRVIYPIPVPEPAVSVILLAGSDPVRLNRCLDGLLDRTYYSALEVVIAYSNSDRSDFIPPLDPDHRVRWLHHPEACNDAALTNWAVQRAGGAVIVLLGLDVVVESSEWLREMVSHAIRPDVGAVGAKLVDTDGRIQHGGLTVGMFGIVGDHFAHKHRASIGYFGHLQLTRNVTAVSADCLAVRRDIFEQVGGLNETDLAAAFSDVDLCLKLVDHGYRNVWTPYAELSYDAAISPTPPADPATQFPRETAYMHERWGRKLYSDPYWNPNLSVQFNELALAFPPRDDSLATVKAA
jgi:O-antigen biosynthesis protein